MKKIKCTVVYPVVFELETEDNEWNKFSAEEKKEKIIAEADVRINSYLQDPIIHECDEEELID